MGVKEFFKKLGSDTKKAFSKGGAIESGFKKFGGDVKQAFSKGGVIDTGLRKVGNTLIQGAGVASKLAPLAMVVAPEFAPAIMAGSALANVGGKTALGIRSGAMRGKTLEDKTENIVGSITSGIQAGKDVQAQNPNPLNFA